MSYEIIKKGEILFAEIIWADTRVESTRFFSPPESSFQFGLLAHSAGFTEAPHTHHETPREIRDVQQMFVVQRGAISVSFHEADGSVFREVTLRGGDAINLVHGAHSLTVLEEMQCISVKQGPFMGEKLDKKPLDAR